MKYFQLDVDLPEKKIAMNIKATKTVKDKVRKVQKLYKDKNIDLDQNKILEAGATWLEENYKRNLINQ